MAQTTTTERPSQQAADKNPIREFQVDVPEAELTELRRRINATKWPERETVPDQSQGVQLATTQALARYWAKDYDWRKIEAKMNALPQFMTEIDGLDIHFIHVRSKHENALPLIVTHGWPGSVIEQMKIIEPLSNPTAHGGTAADAFHLVIPSLPGYGFSGKPTKPGWNPFSIAKAWATLMQRLGYTSYVAQGGDWGNAVSEVMALQQPPGLLGIHTNMAATVPPDVSKALSAGAPPPAGLSPEEKLAWDQLDDFYKNGLGYANEMALRPQTLYGIVDSPVGLAGWILDHDIRSYQMIARVFDGKPEGLSRDDVLDNITLYWLTNTAISSARLYWDTRHNLPAGGFFDARGVEIPVGVSAFAEEIYQAPKSWAEKAYVKLVHYSKHPKGTHFAAWEQPALFVSDVRATFQSLRKSA
jgi:pimeloyl-ACP methyl ester carboxylesterase